jgi:hypothetical protein
MCPLARALPSANDGRGNLSRRPFRRRLPLHAAQARHRHPGRAGTHQADLIRTEFGGVVCVPDLDQLAKEVISSAQKEADVRGRSGAAGATYASGLWRKQSATCQAPSATRQAR